jgi:hypothetical protein
MKVEVICKPNNLAELLAIETTNFGNAIRLAFLKIDQNDVVSSWKDSVISSEFESQLSNFIEVPKYGCYMDSRKIAISNPSQTIENIWAIGGKTGWYYASWLWKFRGFLDKLVGGVGLRRGRTNNTLISAGDSLDFWRVILADKTSGRLLLFAEMKLPGEAWLEFNVSEKVLHQTATFRPRGLWGRDYWYLVLPFHAIIFKNMIKKIGA